MRAVQGDRLIISDQPN